ncbi:cysteine-rich receptor-like protein kinase 44 [Miscanthus floridulus]|uniref:cysteine-rich receptor-like protein kinase 44 n=1 Tax=Miscanthus floridulus TaxID=154761 RepID=UPI00345A5E56
MNNERYNTREVPTDFPWKLIEDITNGFALEQKIGSGGYGVVYKGVHPNGQEVAVKKLYHMPGLDEDQFQNELRILTRICHPNIVQLVGKSYIEQDRCVEHQGRLVFATKIERAICLEFLPKGSLEKHLSDERSGLRWHSRYKIIKGICEGLKYLHGERIFHLDLKPSNILLDKDMVPKIADFGLSRLFSGTFSFPLEAATLMVYITVTYAMLQIYFSGYAPPEYVDMGKITKKFDVFSLGVIIIKILTGSDGYSTYSDMSSSQDFIDLLQVQRNWRNMLLMVAWKDASYLDAYCNQVKTCTEIAVKCVESNSHKRPSIEDVISMLNQTEETIDKLYRQLFVVQPLNLCFPFEPDKLIPCPVQLTNNADHHIAYRIQPNSPDIFVGSLNGTVPARSTQTYILTMQKQQKPPPNLSTIHIQSVAANLDLSLNIDYMFNKAEAVHDVSKQVKITSLHECASQLAFKPRIEVLSLNPTYSIDIHPLEPWWVLIKSGGIIEIWNCRTRVSAAQTLASRYYIRPSNDINSTD